MTALDSLFVVALPAVTLGLVIDLALEVLVENYAWARRPWGAR